MTIRVMEGKWSQPNEKKVMETVQRKIKNTLREISVMGIIVYPHHLYVSNTEGSTLQQLLELIKGARPYNKHFCDIIISKSKKNTQTECETDSLAFQNTFFICVML